MNGSELYDIVTDKYQEHNIAAEHPEVVNDLLKKNAKFIKATKKFPQYKNFITPIVGSKEQEVSVMTIQHAIGSDYGFWRQEQICEGRCSKNDTYAIQVTESGTYEISCCRWPRECPAPILGTPNYNPKNFLEYSEIHPEEVYIKIGKQEFTKSVKAEDTEVRFNVQLKKGTTMFTANFIEKGEKFGVYYNYIQKK